MPQTRSGKKTSAASTAKPAPSSSEAKAGGGKLSQQSPKEKNIPSEFQQADALKSKSPNVSKKRNNPSTAEQQRPAKKPRAKADRETENQENQNQRPRLTTPDLEFDFDRSQLRDPRPTPGRKARPRYGSLELEMDKPELKKKFETDFFIPKPEKPKGRLNALQKDDLFRKESLLSPIECFHDLYQCHKKGPSGTPTYDSAGFELDWNKVDDCINPKSYNKAKIVRDMERYCDEKASRDKQMVDIFFTPVGSMKKKTGLDVMHYLTDHISKDLGVPFHQIGLEEAKQWEEKGFEKFDFDTWWKEPNEVERERMSKMTQGSRLRKDSVLQS